MKCEFLALLLLVSTPFSGCSCGPVQLQPITSDAGTDAVPRDDAGFDAGFGDAGFDDAGFDDAGFDDAGFDDAGFDDAGFDAGFDHACDESQSGVVDPLIWARHISTEPSASATSGVGRMSLSSTADDTTMMVLLTQGSAHVEPGGGFVPLAGQGSTATTTLELSSEGALRGAMVLWGIIVGSNMRGTDAAGLLALEGLYLGDLHRDDALLAVGDPTVPFGFFARAGPGALQLDPAWVLESAAVDATGNRGGQIAAAIQSDGAAAAVTGLYLGSATYRAADNSFAVLLPAAGGSNAAHFVARHAADGALQRVLAVDGTFTGGAGFQPALLENGTTLLTGFVNGDVGFGDALVPAAGNAVVFALLDDALDLETARVFPVVEGSRALFTPWARVAARRCAPLLSGGSGDEGEVLVDVDGDLLHARAVEGVDVLTTIACFDDALSLDITIRMTRGPFIPYQQGGRASDLAIATTSTGFATTGGFRGSMTIVDAEGASASLSAPAEDIVNGFVAFFSFDGVLMSLRHLSSCSDVAPQAITILSDGDYVVAGEFTGTLRLSDAVVFERPLDRRMRDGFVARFAGSH